MTVFVAHAPADRRAAEALEAVLERRGQFVELDDGHTALRPVEANDVLVLMVSQALALATARLRLEQRALDAWTAGRLLLVRLDDSSAPVGLRDLPAIDAVLEAQREAAWNEAADLVRERLKTPSRPEAQDGTSEATAAPAAPRKANAGPLLILAALLAAAPGLAAVAAAGSIWLANRIGPTPGGWTELIAGVEAFGEGLGLPGPLTPWLFALTIGVTLAVLGVLLARLTNARSPRAPAAAGALFVSYARANSAVVLPVIEAAKRAERRFWLDQKGAAPSEGWAGDMARAIRSAAGVVVMCSKAAFESDQVKREIYLADRYRKKLVPVFIEAAEPPEDFDYFFAGAQSLNLFETPEAERPEALARLLGTAA